MEFVEEKIIWEIVNTRQEARQIPLGYKSALIFYMLDGRFLVYYT